MPVKYGHLVLNMFLVPKGKMETDRNHRKPLETLEAADIQGTSYKMAGLVLRHPKKPGTYKLYER